jgi:hypothetical protein
MTGMKHLRKPGWTMRFVLGWLFLRSLIPAGFMVAPADRALGIVLCNAEMSMSGPQNGGDQDQDQDQDLGQNQNQNQNGNASANGNQQHRHQDQQQYYERDQLVHDPAHHDGVHSGPACPYAQSAGPAPLPTLPVVAGSTGCDRLIAPAEVTQTRLSFGPPRQQSSRGPPPLA